MDPRRFFTGDLICWMFLWDETMIFFARCVRERGRDSLSIALTAYLLEVKIDRLMWVSVSHVLAMD